MEKITTFFKEVKQETKKVSWPTKNDALRYSALVIVASLLVAGLLGFFDYVLVILLGEFVF